MVATASAFSAYMLIPMDQDQKDHLKAYGIAYWVLQTEMEAYWLLNYRGGSFRDCRKVAHSFKRDSPFLNLPLKKFNGLI